MAWAAIFVRYLLGREDRQALRHQLQWMGAHVPLTIAHLKAMDVTKMPSTGIDTVTVPGAVEGWNKLHERFGHLPWKDLFTPAIFFAENGFAMPELDRRKLADSVTKPEKDSGNLCRVFLVHDEAPKVGDLFKNPDVAKALRLPFYRRGVCRLLHG